MRSLEQPVQSHMLIASVRLTMHHARQHILKSQATVRLRLRDLQQLHKRHPELRK